ncbi:transposase [Streptomyces sp. NPDC015184]|uniref:transposase n=1 Tax=Streptomyces sp. NPDC015184 TaxID=3364946 RepID=UPI0036F59AB6
MAVSGRRSGCLSVAGLIAVRPGSRTRLCHRLRTHPAGRGKRRSAGERDFIALIDGVHQLVKAPIALVRDRLNTHVSHAMRELIAERARLTVFLLPAHSPDLNPAEWVWAHVKRSLANLAVVALARLDDPAGKSVEAVRPIRDEMDSRRGPERRYRRAAQSVSPAGPAAGRVRKAIVGSCGPLTP